MRLAFVTPWDTDNKRAWSGVVYPMVRALEEHCDVVPISTQSVPDSVLDRGAARLLDGRRGRKYLVGHAVATAVQRGRYLRSRLAEAKPDVVLAAAASQDIAFLGGDLPVIQVSDATLASISDYYDQFTRILAVSRWQAEMISRRSARRADHTLAATGWARDSLIRDDGIDPAAITVAPFGPAIIPQGDEPTRSDGGVGPLKMLAVVSNWERKGGSRVVGVFEELIRRGLDVGLTIVGDVPEGLPPRIHAPGRVHPGQLRELYASSHLLLELARSNAAGVTLTDAAAFGLPVVATDTGGVSTIVEDGVTGILVPARESLVIAAAADAVQGHLENFELMGRAASRRATTELSWEAWSDAAMAAVCHLAAEHRPHPS
ncbi:glycosyltransferase family 4 protein [Tessaracoccus sp. G1721]